MYYPCTFCTCAKYKSAVVHHRRWFSADGLPSPSELFPSQMYYPCTFCTCAKYKSAVVHHRRRPACLRRLNYSLLRCTTHVPFVLVQNTSQRSSTIDDGSPLTACLRRLNYSLRRCTTHVPFVLVQNTSQRSCPRSLPSYGSPLINAAPPALPSFLACLPSFLACLPLTSGKVPNKLPM